MDGDESPVLLQKRGCIVDPGQQTETKPENHNKDAFAVKLQ